MDKNDSLKALNALSNGTRLDVFRLLVKVGETGMPAGSISDELGIVQNTMSSALSILSAANLIRSEREGRSIRYYANMDGMRGLLSFLMEDCCGGNPEMCSPFLNQLTPTANADACAGTDTNMGTDTNIDT